MKQLLKIVTLLKATLRDRPGYHPLQNWLAARRRLRERQGQEGERKAWEARGRPIPPPHAAKQEVLRRYAQRYGLKIFVETGTYRGEMVEAMKPLFKKIYSIELSEQLFAAARRRFRWDSHVELIRGDSGRELGRIVATIDQPALFWLDGHYSAGITARGEKDTPIFEELGHILRAPDLGHVIVIDDARHFGSDPAYPTLEELRKYLLSRRPHVRVAVEGDSIRITPTGP
jgi:hypothetical protein